MSHPPLRRRLRRWAGGTVAGLLAVGVLAGPGLGLPGPAGDGVLGTPAAAADVEPAEAAPLRVRITRLTPATIPERGPVRVRGTVSNTSDQTWRAVNVHPFVGSTPMTSAAELVDAAATDPRSVVGRRRTEALDQVGDLAPGESVRFRLRIPRDLLPGAGAGVYWFGVHALGTSTDGRDGVADGRARTFLPLVAPDRRDPAVPLAVVLPLRHELLHTPEGRVDEVEEWADDLAEGGRLDQVVAFARNAVGFPLTWLIDPAVVRAVSSLAVGNPPRAATEPPDGNTPAASGSASPTPSASPGPEMTQDPGPIGAEEVREQQPDGDGGADTALRRTALEWLEALDRALTGAAVLGLPYGDPHNNALARGGGTALLDRARELSDEELARLDLDGRAGVAAPTGLLSAAAIAAADPGATVLVSDRILPEDVPTTVRATVAGRRVLVSSSGAAAGGPGPSPPLTPMALRQRILAEAALRTLDSDLSGDPADDPVPLVVVLPDSWSPRDPQGRFFSGLRQPWLDPVPVADLPEGSVPEVAPDALTEATTPARHLDTDNLAAARGLIDAASSLQRLLTGPQSLQREATGEALSTLSWANARHPDVAEASARAAEKVLRRQVSQISIDVPSYVTLSSESGRLPVALANDLDHAVTVKLEAVTDPELSISAPETIELEPESVTSVLVNASSEGIGVHNVRFRITDVTGEPIGVTTRVTIRASQVSDAIWVVIGVGGLLLLGAIGVRMRRGFHRRPDESAADQ